MASSLGPKVGADLTMSSVYEASIPGLKQSEPEKKCGDGLKAEAVSTTKLPESVMKKDKETMTEKDLISEQAFSLGTEAHETNVDKASPNIKEADIQEVSVTGGFERTLEIALVVELAPDSEIEEELGPHILIDVTEETGNKIKLMVIVSMLSPFAESTNTLIHAGDFELEVSSTTTIREIKFGITSTLDICYEDMALVYIGKFLSDARSVEYYFIEEGQTLHLLVEAPNQLFKEVFEAFTSLGLREEKAWFATRSFIHVMHTKYSVEGSDETLTITEEQLMYELEQLNIPDSDDSDDSSADEDEDDYSSYDEDDYSGDEDEVSDMEEISDLDEDEESDDSDIDDHEESDVEEDEGNEIAHLIDYLTTHVYYVAHSTHVELFEWI